MLSGVDKQRCYTMAENDSPQEQPHILNTASNFHLEVLDKIASGGFADVFKARFIADLKGPASQDASNLYAVKIFKPGQEKFWKLEAEMGQLFREETHIVKVFESGVANFAVKSGLKAVMPGEKQGYLLMEYCHGGSLDRQGALPPNEAVRAFGSVASGLSPIHNRGMVYRDLKVQNVMVTGAGDKPIYKLGDMGAVAPTEQQDQAIGTVHTAAPELSEKNATHTADIYSFGILIGQVLTGQQPKPGDTKTPLPLDRLIAQNPALTMNDHIGAFQEVMDKATQMKSDDRYQNLAELYDAILRAHAKGQEALGKAAVHIPFRYKTLEEQEAERNGQAKQQPTALITVNPTFRYSTQLTDSANKNQVTFPDPTAIDQSRDGKQEAKQPPVDQLVANEAPKTEADKLAPSPNSPEGVIAAQAAKIAELQVELDRRDGLTVSLMDKLDAAEAREADMKQWLTELQELLKKTSAENSRLNSRVRLLTASMSELQKELDGLRAKYNKLKEDEYYIYPFLSRARSIGSLTKKFSLPRSSKNRKKPALFTDEPPLAKQSRRSFLQAVGVIGTTLTLSGVSIFQVWKRDHHESTPPLEKWSAQERSQNKAAVTSVLLELANLGDDNYKQEIATALAAHNPKESAALISALTTRNYFAGDALRELAKSQPDLAEQLASEMIEQKGWRDKVAGAAGPTFVIHKPAFAQKLFALSTSGSKEARILFAGLHVRSSETISGALDTFYQTKDYDSIKALAPIVAAQNPSALVQFASTMDISNIFADEWNNGMDAVYEVAKELVATRPYTAETMLKKIDAADMKNGSIYREIPRLAIEFFPSYPGITNAALKRYDKNWYSISEMLRIALAPRISENEQLPEKHLQAWCEFMRQPTDKKLAAQALALFRKEKEGWTKEIIPYMLARGSQY